LVGLGTLEWFAPALGEIARIAAASDSSAAPVSLHISVYVTCLCDPEAVPHIPNCDVTMIRPDVYHILDDLVTTCQDKKLSSSSLQTSTTSDQQNELAAGREVDSASVTTDELDPRASNKLPWLGTGGGVGVCASGPAGLIREASNAVARLRLTRRGMEMGDLDIHTEVFAL